MRIVAFLFLVAAFLLPAFGLVGLILGLVEDFPPLLWGGVALIVVPIMAYLAVRSVAARVGKPAFEAALKEFRADDADWFSGSGIAIDRAGGRVLLAREKLVKVYPLADVVDVKLEHLPGGYAHAAGVGSMGVLGVIIAALAVFSATINYFGSGLFVKTRDPQNPSWQLFGIGAAQARKWRALLQGEQA